MAKSEETAPVAVEPAVDEAALKKAEEFIRRRERPTAWAAGSAGR
jgi:hypothetical protein